MRLFPILLVAALPSLLSAQVIGVWPPDSLVNLQVLPRNTPVQQLIGMMRNFTGYLGVRCEFCHVGEAGRPLTEFDFASDAKRTKRVARQMMLMLREVNGRLDTLPSGDGPEVQVTCGTCHRGVTRPVPLSTLITEAAVAGGADSAAQLFRSLRARHHGGDAYNFLEPTLNIAAFQLGRRERYADAFGLLVLNEEYFPGSSGMYVFRGNIHLMQGDTTAAASAFREAIRRDPRNEEARFRLNGIGRSP